MRPQQNSHGKEVLRAVSTRAHKENWTKPRARKVALLCIQCCLTESVLWVWASGRIRESLRLPHDLVGWDHYSVGVFQQQPEPYLQGSIWGPVEKCQDPYRSTFGFLDRLHQLGFDRATRSPANRLKIQAVQVSFDKNGWNYAASYTRAQAFVVRHWDYRNMKPK